MCLSFPNLSLGTIIMTYLSGRAGGSAPRTAQQQGERSEAALDQHQGRAGCFQVPEGTAPPLGAAGGSSFSPHSLRGGVNSNNSSASPGQSVQVSQASPLSSCVHQRPRGSPQPLSQRPHKRSSQSWSGVEWRGGGPPEPERACPVSALTCVPLGSWATAGEVCGGHK